MADASQTKKTRGRGTVPPSGEAVNAGAVGPNGQSRRSKAGPSPPEPRSPGPKTPPFEFRPFATYKGMVRRVFIVLRHVLGLLAGGVIAYVNALPPERRRGLRSPASRSAAFFLRPIVKSDLRNRPFAVQLRRRLELLGPTYVKLGQIMAIREDLLPKHVTDELSTLLDRLPPIPFPQVRSVVERSLHRPLDVLFAHIDEKPLASASIAQVHRARTLAGDEVVIKVIKPGITETIRADLKLLRLVGTFLQWIFSRYQPKRIIEEFSAYTRREVDFNYEADNAETFAANFQDVPGVVFPTIHRELSSQEVLTMEYLDGVKPTPALARSMDDEVQERVIDLGAAAIIRMLFRDGFFHADLHAGNLLILPGDEDRPVQVGFIDLGMTGRFEEKTKRQLLYYFRALIHGNIEEATRYLTALATVGEGGDPQGFRRAVADLSRRFTMRYNTGQLSLAQLILESLNLGGKYRVFFPVEMTLMVKALVTFEGVGRTFKPNLDIPRASQKHVADIFEERYNVATVARELYREIPELLDLSMRLPQLLSTSFAYLEEAVSDRQPSTPAEDLHTSILAAACILGGVIAVVFEGPFLLWFVLFGAGLLLAIFGR